MRPWLCSNDHPREAGGTSVTHIANAHRTTIARPTKLPTFLLYSTVPVAQSAAVSLNLGHTNGWAEDGGELDRQGWETDRGRLFISNGDGSFTELSSERGTLDDDRGHAVVCADFDSDGDVDIFVTTRNASNAHLFFRNNMAGFERNSSLSVTLAGDAPNTQAAGARIKVTVDDITQTREITIGSNFTSQNPTTQLFGLGGEVRANSVEIDWPSINGLPSRVDIYTNIPAGSIKCTPGECVSTPRQRLRESE